MDKGITIVCFMICLLQVSSTSSTSSLAAFFKMVEGHSVHRVAAMHRARLVGKRFHARSPNGRFTEGAKAIDGKVFSRIEAVGKIYLPFSVAATLMVAKASDDSSSDAEDDLIVVHVHFGMAWIWAVFHGDEQIPAPTATNRLRIVNEEYSITADLSAMTVQHGGMELYTSKLAKLGHDPLRDDADPEELWRKVSQSKKSIGFLIMDQSFFCGPGNIYRAEILFKAGVHPDVPGNELSRDEFDAIWKHTVELLGRGFETGSILTVDPIEAQQLGKPKLRRYIYNTAKCPRCASSIQVWDIASRTCYACPRCQPRNRGRNVVTPEKKAQCVPFISHCARESLYERLISSGPTRLTVKELKEQLHGMNIEIPSKAVKVELVSLCEKEMEKQPKHHQKQNESLPVFTEMESIDPAIVVSPVESSSIIPETPTSQSNDSFSSMKVTELKAELTKRGITFPGKARKNVLINLLLQLSTDEALEIKNDNIANNKKTNKSSFILSSEEAAMEKATAGETLAVEHIAELAPSQARRARARVQMLKKEEEEIDGRQITPKRISKRRRML